MERSAEAIPIKDEQLSALDDRATAFLKQVRYVPKATVEGDAAPGTLEWRRSPVADIPQEREVSLFKLAYALNPKKILLPDKANHVLQAIWQGIRIGAHLSALYTQASGLNILMGRNERRELEGSDKVEFRDKNTTAAAISIFAAAYYVSWELSRVDGESKIDIDGVPEINLQSPVEAMNCILYYYGTYLGRPSLIQTPDDIVRMTQLYFRAVIDKVIGVQDSLKYTEPFTSRTYKLEKGEFSVNGFRAEIGLAAAVTTFNEVRLDEIVGNREAKRQAKLIAQRLVCFDFKTRLNPFMELGGLPKLRMGSGPPGTGKTMLISATATLLKQYCERLGYPFAFCPLPDTIISTFQGGSAINGTDWFRLFEDPTRILYGSIDDAEVVLEDRTRPNVSAGVREFIGVFLRRTEGAYAPNRGNYLIDVYTNIPDQFDRAVLSRIVYRFLIAGATNRTDFTDQDHTWWKKYDKYRRGFVNMADPKGHVYMANQRLLASLSEAKKHYNEPRNEKLAVIFRRTLKQSDPTNHAFFGMLFEAVQQEFPFFTSRDVRNIQMIVDGRVLDFELPEEWLDHPDQFYHRDYEAKKAMLVELMLGNMKGLSFAEVRLQEAVSYLDEMVRIMDAGHEREVDELVQRAIRAMEAEARVKTMEKEGRLDYIKGVDK